MSAASTHKSFLSSLDDNTQSQLSKIQELLPEKIFVITTAKVEQLKTAANVEVVELARLICIYLSLPSTVSPISHFAAGAVVIGATGAMYVGFNIEYCKTPLGETIHAEQCAISNAVLHKEPKIDHIVTIPTPCGHCRQFIRECVDAENITVHSCDNTTGTFIFHLPLFELLPHSFGPSDLGSNSGVLDVNDKTFVITDRTLPESEENDQVIKEALNWIPRSHSPHTKSWCSVVIVWLTIDGIRTLSPGVYLENAAYNPSLGALQCALVSLLTSNGNFSNIQKVFVFEDQSAQVLHLAKTKLLLDNIAPTATLQYQPIQIS